jgi:hypothetical protein
MANQNRRITRAIKGAVKKLKRGEVPFPPDPKVASPEEEKQFIEEMKRHRQWLQSQLDRLSSDGSRRGHKRRLQISAELDRIRELKGIE